MEEGNSVRTLLTGWVPNGAVCIEFNIQALGFRSEPREEISARDLEETWTRYTFMTGVSCSSELWGRMVLLFECSFSRFCRKPLLLRPSRMLVLVEARLTRVLWGGERREGARG